MKKLGVVGVHPSLKFQRVTIRGAQPSARLSEEICLSEGSAGSLRGLCGDLSEGSAGLCGVLRGSATFSGVFGGSDPMLVTLANCWIQWVKLPRAGLNHVRRRLASIWGCELPWASLSPMTCNTCQIKVRCQL